jgi:hypothetical protein
VAAFNDRPVLSALVFAVLFTLYVVLMVVIVWEMPVVLLILLGVWIAWCLTQ